VGLDYHYSEGYMYWSDIRNGTLNRAFLNGANVEVLFHTDDPLIIDLAVDWVNEKIYWTEAIRSPGVNILANRYCFYGSHVAISIVPRNTSYSHPTITILACQPSD
jgi:hypothetical protein